MNAVLTAQQNDALAKLTWDDRGKTRLWMAICTEFEQADDKGLALATLMEKYAGQVEFSRGTLYRRMAAFRAAGVAGLAAQGDKPRGKEVQLAAAFITECWQRKVLENQRKIAPAYRSLFWDELRAGKVIPGYGTDWRGIWRAENENRVPPDECPYTPHHYTPEGWSERNLRRYCPDRYALAAARIGRAAAANLLPKLPTTRVGLRFGQVFVIDDVYHDAKVSFAGNREPQICVELGALELLSGHYCSWGIKPVRERDDETKEHLQEAFTRYLLVDILCRVGICPDGCLICGEHGTAKLPADLVAAVEALAPGMLRFDAGGLRHEPIARGLFEGRPGGNFRFKAALESHHALKKNELAQLPGQKGADPEHSPEDLATKVSYHRALVKAAAALATARPDLLEELSSPFPSYYRYIEAVGLLYDRIADRTVHGLEGFDELGFTVEEFAIAAGMPHVPLAQMLAGKSDGEQGLIRELVRRSPAAYRRRLMSPREACHAASQAHQVMRLPDSVVPQILGAALGERLQVGEDQTMAIADKYVPGKQSTVAAVVRTARGDELLERGSRWLVHASPLDASAAYISTLDGRYVGKAPVLLPGTKADMASARRNLGIIRRVEAAELKRLAPEGERRLRAEAEMRARNVAVLTGRDPLAEVAAAEEQVARLRGFQSADLLAADGGDDVGEEASVAAGARFDAAGLL